MKLNLIFLFYILNSYFILDTNNNLRSDPRICSVSLRPGIDSIGISLQPDKDFGHIIKQVEPNSPAYRAGIERDDCILSLNDTSLLNVPYDDVLNTIKKNRNEPNLDFVVAKKSFLLKSRQRDTSGEVMPSSNIPGRTTSTVPPSQALEELYYKYNKEQTNANRPRETVSTTTTTERYDRLSPQLDGDRYASKEQQGQILQGVGPATADRSALGVSSGKPTDDLRGPISGDSTIRSSSQGRRQG